MKTILTFIFFILYGNTTAQLTEEIVEQQVEQTARINEDVETEDDSFLQQLQEYIRHPINLNTATEQDLAVLQVITPLQAEQLLSYRKLIGDLIDLYELQAVPGWSVELIQKIRLYVTVSLKNDVKTALLNRFKKSSSTILFRISQAMERSRGYLQKGDSVKNYYRGSPQKILLRYTGSFKNLLQYGILAEKDAGEQFFKGRQKLGFDFYSAHIFLRNLGLIKALAIGDFTARLGQGLTEWQGQSFSGGDVASVKRQAPVLAPYHSPGEAGFHRGVGVTIGRKSWEMTCFASYRVTDGNFVKDSTTGGEFISSQQVSGYHRTTAEVADKGIQRQIAFGGRVSFTLKRLKLGINGVAYSFRLPLFKGNDPYEKYALRGRNWINYSIDYGYTLKNCHFFGELAFTRDFAKAFLGGLILSLSSSADLNLVCRYIQPAYQSVNGNAFTHSSSPSNENSLYTAFTLRSGPAWRVDVYADLFYYPWLRYRTDAPSRGTEYGIRLSYKPNKTTELYSIYRSGSQLLNYQAVQPMTAVGWFTRKSLRIHLNTRLFNNILFRGRVEVVWTGQPGRDKGSGTLFYADIVSKPLFRSATVGGRLQYFETDGYENRVYAYENDVLYDFSSPVFYDKGFRYYINIQYGVNKRLTCWLRVSQTLFRDKTLIGSGLDEIEGSRKSEIKFQSFYKL